MKILLHQISSGNKTENSNSTKNTNRGNKLLYKIKEDDNYYSVIMF